MGLAGPALVTQQPSLARRGAQLPGFRLLSRCPVKRGDVAALRPCQVALEREQPALHAENFCIDQRSFQLGSSTCAIDQMQRTADVAELRHAPPRVPI